jgi:RNA polymerase sigma-70 factor (ECF subfamily)
VLGSRRRVRGGASTSFARWTEHASDYVGPWLPEPIQRINPPGADRQLAASLMTAFLLVLQRLTRRERAAYLLRDVFDQPYPQIGAALDMEEAACRQLVSRARAHIERGKVRHITPIGTQEQLLRAFEAAITSGDTTQLAEMLSSDIRLTTDSGRKASAVLRVLEGEEVLPLLRRAHTWWKGCSWTLIDLGGSRGAILRQDGQAILALSFGYNDVDQVTDIFITRNPDKLTRLDPILLI